MIVNTQHVALEGKITYNTYLFLYVYLSVGNAVDC